MTDYIKKIKSIEKKLLPASYTKKEGNSMAIVFGAYTFLGFQLGKYLGLGKATYHIAGAGAYLTGMLVDNISTIKCMKADNEFYHKHGFHVAYEVNPLLPKHPTAKDLLGVTKKGAVAGTLDFLFLTFSAILPPIGLGILTVRLFPYLNNNMTAKQIKLTDKLLEERMPNASPEEKKKFLDEILEEAKVK